MTGTGFGARLAGLRGPLRLAGAAAIVFGLVSIAITWALAWDGTEPLADVFTARRVPLLWCVVVIGAGVVLLLVSAVLAGDGESSERQRVK